MNKVYVFLFTLLIVGLILTTIVPQNVLAEQYTVYNQVSANNENGTEYLEGVANRIMLILGIIGGVIIAGMWLWIGVEYHMANQQRREELKEKMMWALIGSIIIAMAVGGIIWMLARWIAGV